MDLDKGAGLKLDVSLIPKKLHWLVPFVERWGWESLDDQDEFVASMERERANEVREFSEAMDRGDADIRRWSASLDFLHKHTSEMTEEDWNHPYWAFLSAMKVREITGYHQETQPEIEARERFANEMRLERFKDAAGKADELFREGRYREFIERLAPYLDLLSPVQQAKMKFANKKNA
jgi:hypothetical protein